MFLNLHPNNCNYNLVQSELKCRMEFNRYKIPPNFQLTQLHQKAALVYDETGNYTDTCPCCDRTVGDKSVSMCSSTAKLMRISEQLPLYFSYIKSVIMMLLLYMIALVGQISFSSSVQQIKFKLQMPNYGITTLQLGFIETQRQIRFVYFILFACFILFLRGFLKKNKYQVKYVVDKISNRTTMLANVNPHASIADITQVFNRYNIQNIVFTYKVQNYSDCLQIIYRLKKEHYLAIQHRQSFEAVNNIQDRIQILMKVAEDICRNLRSPQNRLDFVFITLRDQQQKKKFIQKYSTNLIMRLFCKLCNCFSDSVILEQHVTVAEAPDPQDIDWINFESGYWTKKLHRFACYYMSFGILIYGVMFQYELSTLSVQSFYITIIKSGVVFVGNFLIITLLEYTTYQVEKHELNTNKILSLTKKLTFFIFLNLSMSPLSVYIYTQFANVADLDPTTSPFDDLCFSLVIICLGNILKPLAEYFKVGRIWSWISFYIQRSKGMNCQMTQQQANEAYQPIPFPLASFYSLLISSFFVTTFFLSCFQILIVIEIISCVILFLISKYMLIHVCKQPIGLNNKISILCQRLLSLTIYLYWIGQKLMYFFLVQKNNQTFSEYILDYEVYELIQLGFMLFIFIFSPKILSLISHRIARQEDIRDSFIQKANSNQNRMNYEEVNSIKKIEEEYYKFFSAIN